MEKPIGKSYILRHIRHYATSDVIGRGKQLFEKGAVNLEKYDDSNDTWKFQVKGSLLYKVHVKGLKRKSITTSCNCPFNWGGICKHCVAALYFIADDLVEETEEEPVKKKLIEKRKVAKVKYRSDLGFEIKDYKKITPQFVQESCSYRVFNQIRFYNSNKFSKVEITDNSIVFSSKNKDTTVSLFKRDAKVFVTSSDSIKLKELSLNEARCLNMIAYSPTPHLLEMVFGKTIVGNERDMLKNYGISENVGFSKYFLYTFDQNHGLRVKVSKKGYGLVPVVNSDQNPIINLIERFNSDDQILDNLPTKKEKREIGFVLKLAEDGYYDDYGDYDGGQQGYEIVAIVGKPNKTKTVLNSHIERFDDIDGSEYQIYKSENSQKLLKIINKIDSEDDELTLLHLYKRAFYYLQNEKFIFGLHTPSHQIKKNNLEIISISQEPLDIVFEVSKSTEFLKLNLIIKIGEKVFKRSKIDDSKSDEFIYNINDTYHCAKDNKIGQYLSQFPENVKMVKSHKEEFFNSIVKPVSKNFKISFNKGTFKSEQVELDFSKKQLYLSEKDEHVVFTPQVVYDNDISAVLHSTGNILSKENGSVTEYKRNFELEEDFIESIASLHPEFETQKSRKLFYLHYSEFTKDMWFYKFFDQLQANNIEVYGLKDLKNFKYSPYKGKISTSVSSGEDWFEVGINVSFGDVNVSLNDIKRAVINKERYIKLKDGSVGVLPSDWFHKLEKYFRNGEIKKDKLEISKLRFSIIDELFDNIDNTDIINEIAEKRGRLAKLTKISKTKVPTQVKAELRHYQKEGLNWLNFLDEMQWGGILADDMGLGKTLQILTFLQHKINKDKTTNLIVVPTTLLFNWENEIKKFTPKLKALYYYGTDRIKDIESFKDYHLVFTTYGILLRDIEILSKFKFNYAILDESQAIKNPSSRRYKAASLINANNRIAMTGTPIENGTFDLYSQMSFVNRGFFNGAKAFKDSYSNPIDKDGNEMIANELHKIINPFILRRTKEKVASELPPKTEDIIYCEMESEQRKVYDAYRNEYKDRLLNKIEDDGIGKSKMMVLAALTRLRQICDSPALLKSDEISEKQSIKIKEIVRHISNKTGNHKILIFSQFVSMLGLIKDELAKLNIEYEYLDGKSSIKQREQSVNNFQENDSLRVFLISLKAGGTGLNLTAADYVYIVDPWWNPAVENQAIDRCYRIGQEKKVFAYRMICKNTVEEKIINLQNKKKKIAGDIIQTDENIMKKLNIGDIKELFS